MFLEIATTLGALAGAFVASRLSTKIISLIFGGVLIYSAFLSIWGRHSSEPEYPPDLPPDRLAVRLKMDGNDPTPEGPKTYHV